jgi:hypothetical protein
MVNYTELIVWITVGIQELHEMQGHIELGQLKYRVCAYFE